MLPTVTFRCTSPNYLRLYLRQWFIGLSLANDSSSEEVSKKSVPGAATSVGSLLKDKGSGTRESDPAKCLQASTPALNMTPDSLVKGVEIVPKMEHDKVLVEEAKLRKSLA